MKLQKINRYYLYIWIVTGVFLLNLFPTNLGAEQVNTPGKSTTFTLEQLVQSVRQNSLPVKIAELDRRIAVETYRDTRALPNPELEYSRGRGKSADEPGKPEIWGASLKWSLPNPIHRYYFLESARTHITEAEIQAEINQREVVKNLATHFYKLRLYHQLKTFLAEKRRILEEAAKLSRAKVDIGEAKEIDYLRASVAVQENNTELFRVEKSIVHEKNKLRELLDFTIPEDFTISADFDFTPLPTDVDETHLRQLLETSPLIRLETNRLQGEKAGLKAARFSIIESIDLFGEKGKEIDGNTWSLGIGVSIPLFNQKSAFIRQAQLQKQKAETELVYSRNRFFADIRQIIAEIRVLEKEIETFTGAVLKEGRENMEMSEKLFREGEVPLLVFLDSQDSFFDIQARYHEAVTEWNILKAELDALLGENK
ncbi:MAG TPA: TolC family protein [Candidatus Deferrimicrobium sp.]|nr:TolC family protein [Candidatus Deferrimicrobium sp.]